MSSILSRFLFCILLGAFVVLLPRCDPACTPNTQPCLDYATLSSPCGVRNATASCRGVELTCGGGSCDITTGSGAGTSCEVDVTLDDGTLHVVNVDMSRVACGCGPTPRAGSNGSDVSSNEGYGIIVSSPTCVAPPDAGDDAAVDGGTDATAADAGNDG